MENKYYKTINYKIDQKDLISRINTSDSMSKKFEMLNILNEPKNQSTSDNPPALKIPKLKILKISTNSLPSKFHILSKFKGTMKKCVSKEKLLPANLSNEIFQNTEKAIINLLTIIAPPVSKPKPLFLGRSSELFTKQLIENNDFIFAKNIVIQRHQSFQGDFDLQPEINRRHTEIIVSDVKKDSANQGKLDPEIYSVNTDLKIHRSYTTTEDSRIVKIQEEDVEIFKGFFPASEKYNKINIFMGFSSLFSRNFKEKVWVYRDVEGKIQGPFSSLHMDFWNVNSFFPPNLLISWKQAVQFVTIEYFKKDPFSLYKLSILFSEDAPPRPQFRPESKFTVESIVSTTQPSIRKKSSQDLLASLNAIQGPNAFAKLKEHLVEMRKCGEEHEKEEMERKVNEFLRITKLSMSLT